MTRRDVAVWFCKVIALVGIVSSLFSFATLLSRFFGFPGFNNFFSGLPGLCVFGSVWLFAQGIGTELAAEGEYGAPMTSVRDLNALILRCVGFGIFIYSALSLFNTLVIIGFGWYSMRSSLGTSYLPLYWPTGISALIEGTLGFFLAFAPRIRALFRSQ